MFRGAVFSGRGVDLCVNISKTVQDKYKVTMNRKLCVRFRLASSLVTLDDLEL